MHPFTKLRYMACRKVECFTLLGGEIYLEDLFNPASSEFHGEANKCILYSVFAGCKNAAGQYLLLVFKYRFDHLYSRCSRGVERASGLEKLNNLRTAVSGSLNQGIYPLFRHKLRNWHTCNGRKSRERNHVIPMATQDKRMYVLYRNPKLHRNECSKPRGVQNPSHPHYPLFWESAYLVCHIGHDIKRVCNHYKDCIRRPLCNLTNNSLYNPCVG